MSTEQPTLFGHAIQDELRNSIATIESRERVVIDRFITLDSKRFDLDDLIETLDQVAADTDVLVEPRLGNILVKLKVLSSRGSRAWSMGATTGENFELFRSLLPERQDS